MELDAFKSFRNDSIERARNLGIFGVSAIIVIAACGIFFFPAQGGEVFMEPLESKTAIEPASNTLDELPVESNLKVHITGSVVSPGVYTLEAKSRVIDAINAAGGLLEEADESAVNLARELSDGEQIYIPNSSLDGKADGDSLEAQSNYLNETEHLVNINRATIDELQTLPGIGPQTAKRIVADRSQNGSYQSLDELQRVSGIGEKKIAALEGYATV